MNLKYETIANLRRQQRQQDGEPRVLDTPSFAPHTRGSTFL